MRHHEKGPAGRLVHDDAGEDLDTHSHAGKEPPLAQFAGAAKDHSIGFERAFGHLTSLWLVNHAAEF